MRRDIFVTRYYPGTASVIDHHIDTGERDPISRYDIGPFEAWSFEMELERTREVEYISHDYGTHETWLHIYTEVQQ